MRGLVDLVYEIKNNNKEALVEILDMFRPKLSRCLYKTSPQEREDLEQDLSLKILEALLVYDLDATPGFLEFYGQIGAHQHLLKQYAEKQDGADQQNA